MVGSVRCWIESVTDFSLGTKNYTHSSYCWYSGLKTKIFCICWVWWDIDAQPAVAASNGRKELCVNEVGIKYGLLSRWNMQHSVSIRFSCQFRRSRVSVLITDGVLTAHRLSPSMSPIHFSQLKTLHFCRTGSYFGWTSSVISKKTPYLWEEILY